jgi:heterodisulfide reductase subunit C
VRGYRSKRGESVKIKISDKTYDREFVKKLEEISGENFHTCMQCGTCSGACPMGDQMDTPPRRIVLLSHMGLKDRVVDSNTVWMCATCETCYVRCPRGIKLPKLMEAIRQYRLRTNTNYVEPSEISEDVLEDLPQIAIVSCFRKHTS